MSASSLGIILILIPAVLTVYSYIAYPVLLKLVGLFRPAPRAWSDPAEWPLVSILLPAYNEEAAIGRTIEALLQVDYPPDRRQILVISDASTDGTDEIVRSFANRGVDLMRLPERRGKTGAENAAASVARGEIIVNTDATIRIMPGSLKPLVRAFQDPTVGVASGRDVSVGDEAHERNASESGYVGYEMWVRRLETRVGSIVGASGCFFANRGQVRDWLFPEALSRDFASPLNARRAGYRSVSVDDAVCLVPRTRSLRSELRRKARTMARGLETLWFRRELMNPFVYGSFAWMLISHKLCRWLVFLAAPLGPIGLALLSPISPLAGWMLVASLAGIVCGVAGMTWPAERRPPRLIATAGFLLVALLAGLIAWSKALRGELNPIWEPTRRPT